LTLQTLKTAFNPGVSWFWDRMSAWGDTKAPPPTPEDEPVALDVEDANRGDTEGNDDDQVGLDMSSGSAGVAEGPPQPGGWGGSQSRPPASPSPWRRDEERGDEGLPHLGIELPPSELVKHGPQVGFTPIPAS
jgi:hypothetical protein